ncbi:MAG: GTP 3',8-cyclase MoaA [Spirochaetota bacterium]|nr:GTP 3',8-cyclase MoaA [Spirochaetota bacterium]
MLTDKFLRRIDYLRISITDKCNLRCIYCMPKEGVTLLPYEEILRNEEFIHFINIFISLGVRKIRFTGGEPLIRKGFVDIISKTKKLFPDIDLGLTTNGVLLDEVLDNLYSIQLHGLNISLDSMSRERYAMITGRDYFYRVISNIEKAIAFDFFNIKINSVLYEGTIEELEVFLDYFKEKNITLRFIEKMPFTIDERLQSNVSCNDLINHLDRFGDLMRNKRMDTRVSMMYDFYYKNRYKMKIGIIPPMTHNYCHKCNRLRLTCDGFLKTCLLSNIEYDLKRPYRMGIGDNALQQIILQAVSEKPKHHNHNSLYISDEGCSSLAPNRSMSKIGG